MKKSFNKEIDILRQLLIYKENCQYEMSLRQPIGDGPMALVSRARYVTGYMSTRWFDLFDIYKELQLTVGWNLSDLLSKSIIDLGCGTGLLVDLFSIIFKKTYGIEADWNLCKIATIMRPHLEIYNGYVQERVDLILRLDPDIIYAFNITGEPRETFDELFRKMRKGQVFVHLGGSTEIEELIDEHKFNTSNKEEDRQSARVLIAIK